MKKSVIMFVKNGRKFNIRLKETKVEQFDANAHADSNVDKYGRIVHNMRWSETAFAMSKNEWREKTKEAMNEETFSGIYSCGVTADPALIVEFAFDNGIDLGESE